MILVRNFLPIISLPLLCVGQADGNIIKSAHNFSCQVIFTTFLFLLSVIPATSNIAWGADHPYAAKSKLAPYSLLIDAVKIGDQIVIVGERGHILFSIDNGDHWEQAAVPFQGLLTAVYFHNKNLGWAIGHNALIIHTRDGGKTWIRQHYDPEIEKPFLDVLFVDDKNGFAVGAYGLFMKTRDGGNTWTGQRISEDDFHLNSIQFNPIGESLYIVGESGSIYRSNDIGVSWEKVNSPYNGSFFDMLILRDGSLLIFGLRGNLFHSNDGGINWKTINTHTKSALLSGTILNNGDVIVVGMSGTLLLSNDNGKTFHLHRRSDGKDINSVVQKNDQWLLLFGENGIKHEEILE